MPAQFWIAKMNSVKYKNLITGAITHNILDLELRILRKHEGWKKGVRSLYLLEITNKN